MQVSEKNILGFSASALGNNRFSTWNPLLNRPNEDSFIEATLEEVDAAMKLAHQAFASFSRTTANDRAQFLKRIATLLDQNRMQLIEKFSQESGLPADRGTVELNRTIFQLETFSHKISTEEWNLLQQDDADPNRKPLTKSAFRKIAIPLGPVVVFGASNFPFAYSTAGGDTASALAAGCPVVVKSHPFHAGTSNLVAQLIQQATQETGMPDGVFSHLNALGFEVGTSLVAHPLTKAVGFTGSFEGGTALQRIANSRTIPIPVFAEMGSLNPIVILPNGLESTASSIAEKLVFSITNNAGQFCTKPGLIFVLEDPQTTLFLTLLKEKFAFVAPQCMLHPNIYRRYQALKEMVAGISGVEKWIEVRSEIPNFGNPQLSLTNGSTFWNQPALQQEVFGPHALVIICKDQAEIMKCLDALNGQLTASLFANEEELNQHFELIHTLCQKAGRFILNGVPTGVEVCDSMHHGGPFPATTNSHFTAVGSDAIWRFLRPVTLQGTAFELAKYS